MNVSIEPVEGWRGLIDFRPIELAVLMEDDYFVYNDALYCRLEKMIGKVCDENYISNMFHCFPEHNNSNIQNQTACK